MSENRKVIQKWIATVCDKVSNCTNCTCEESDYKCKKSHDFFYAKFGDDHASYDPLNYSFECDLNPHDLPAGKGIITRTKTWVWPKCSGFSSWPILYQ